MKKFFYQLIYESPLLAVFTVSGTVLGAPLLPFIEKDPAKASDSLTFVLVVLFLIPALLQCLGLIYVTFVGDWYAIQKRAGGQAIIGGLPIALLLPFDPIWEARVLFVLFFSIMALAWIYNEISGVNAAQKEAKKQLALARDNERAYENASGGREPVRFRAVRARHKLTDLAGMKDMKDRLLSAAEEVRQGRNKKGAIHSETRNGILLHGEPGNGKTAIAEGLAGTLGLPLIQMAFGDVASMWQRETTANLVKLFKDARQQTPCVLFMDEVDSIASSREFSVNQTEEGPQITNTLLTELVNTRGTGVVLLMATNFIDRLDTAAIREGRVDFKIEVPPPDALARKAIIEKVIGRRGNKITLMPAALEQAVKRWEGFSAARITGIADEALRQAQKSGQTTIQYEDLQGALRLMQGAHGDRIAEDTPALDQLHMSNSQKAALMGVAARMMAIEDIEQMGGTVPSGLLFAGPPGTGKTLTVRALAKSTGWPLLINAGADLLNDSRKIDELVTKAKNIRPCIVFIDEADDVFSDRRMGGNVAASVTNKLLTAMDGAGGKVSDILWVAAVNAPETMDSAALRGGRFTEKIWFENPDEETSERIVRQWMSRSKAQFAGELSAQVIADHLAGESPANINAILQQAVNVMIGRVHSKTGNTEKIVSMGDLEAARLAVLGPPAH